MKKGKRPTYIYNAAFDFHQTNHFGLYTACFTYWLSFEPD